MQESHSVCSQQPPLFVKNTGLPPFIKLSEAGLDRGLHGLEGGPPYEGWRPLGVALQPLLRRLMSRLPLTSLRCLRSSILQTRRRGRGELM
jgi:hypothetical protein